MAAIFIFIWLFASVLSISSASSPLLINGSTADAAPDCGTGNPIDDCWRCDPGWADNRQRLADCAVGFGRRAVGGKGGRVYVVNDTGDDAARPAPGTLRYGLVQDEPLWIVFAGDMTISPAHELVVSSRKTVDGRGARVVVGDGGACFAVRGASDVVIHGLTIRRCRPAPKLEAGMSDGDGVGVHNSSDVWVDHCTVEACADGLIDVVEGSTRVTLSNNLLRNHDKAILLGHNDDYTDDKAMQVTVAFNRFGPGLVQRMPRCRFGLFHVINNDYIAWQKYAIGGSASPTIISHGNRFYADMAKEVTKRDDDVPESVWHHWNWVSDGDLMLNGAFFRASGEARTDNLKAPSFARSAPSVPSMTSSAGALSCKEGSHC
uniref:Pectate lyase n=1 Tax=Oryza glumipatula TaxID=40148 RepID=A0A0D9ZWU2_9ORYZ